MGRPGLRYIIVYQIVEGPALVVLGVFHGAQNQREI